MINVDPPVGDFPQMLVKLVQRKRDRLIKNTLSPLLADLKTSYADYVANSHQPEQIRARTRTAAEIAALKSCYDNSAKFHADLLAMHGIRSEEEAPWCPYCQLKRADQWDHFLPSSRYADYYVYPPNLVRACGTCNPLKNAGLVAPIRKTIHPYFDQLDQCRYLECTVTRVRDALVPQFSINPDRTSPVYSMYVEGVVRAHFLSYGLSRKFRAEASRLASSFLTLMEIWYLQSDTLPDMEAVAKVIALQRRDVLEEVHSSNDWRLVFWDALERSPDVLACVTAHIKRRNHLP